MTKNKPTTIAEYITSASKQAQDHLRELYAVLKEVAPEAEESIKWGQPVFEENRILFSFAAYKSHLNFMPTGPAMQPFDEELADYGTGKDTIRFRYSEPLPKDLIRRIAAHRARDVRENDARWMY